VVGDGEHTVAELVEIVNQDPRRGVGHEKVLTRLEIADELERDHGFIFVSDERLTAAVNVSRDDEDNFLADLSGGEVDGDGRFRTIYADFDPDGRLN
jgi:hypothetical protein